MKLVFMVSSVLFLATVNTDAQSFVTGPRRLYLAEGDSITENGYPELFAPHSNPVAQVINNALSGAVLKTGNNSLYGRAVGDDSNITPGRNFVLSVLIGTNDLEGYTGGTTQYASDLATYLDARRKSGWLVVICTDLPSTHGGFNTVRNDLNAIIKGWFVGLHYDALADFASDSQMGCDACASNLIYYSDGTHPTATGQAILETYIRTAINGL